jgi:hypothetical protein
MFELSYPTDQSTQNTKNIFTLSYQAPLVYNHKGFLGVITPSITDFSTPILVQVVPPRVTPYKREIVLQEAMEENVDNSSRSPHTPSKITTIGGIFPPKRPFSV